MTDLAIRPAWTFAKLYLGKLGFLDGLEGFAFCALSGLSVAVRHFKHRELMRVEEGLMTTALRHEAEVAARFDALAGRFRREVERVRLPPPAPSLRGLAGLAHPLVLDLGCGKGRFARRLAAWGPDVVGTRLSRRAMLAEARGVRPRARFGAATARSLRKPSTPSSRSRPSSTARRASTHRGSPAACSGLAGGCSIVDRNAALVDARRPWLASLARQVDRRAPRAAGCIPPDGPVRERWFWPRGSRGFSPSPSRTSRWSSSSRPSEAERRSSGPCRRLGGWPSGRPACRGGPHDRHKLVLLPSLPLAPWKTPPALRTILEQEGVAFREITRPPSPGPSGRAASCSSTGGRQGPSSSRSLTPRARSRSTSSTLREGEPGDPFQQLLSTEAQASAWTLQGHRVVETRCAV